MVNAIPAVAEKCSASSRNPRSPSSRNRVRNHPGIVFTFVPERRSPSAGIRTLRSEKVRKSVHDAEADMRFWLLFAAIMGPKFLRCFVVMFAPGMALMLYSLIRS